MFLVAAFFLLLGVEAFEEQVSNNSTGCPNRAFIGCILQLKEDHIQFDRNIIRVILSINSEAKLLHTCKSYTNVLPCFRSKVLECGNDQQKEMLIEVGKGLMFLCAPFSLNRQRTLIRHQACMSKVLSLPISAGCKLNKKLHADRLDSCKRHCSTMPKNFTCSLQTWISEQNACTLNDLSDHCGEEAATFYEDLQASIFEPSYPFSCQYDKVQSAPINQNLVTKPPASSIAKTEPANLFTKTHLSTKKPYRQPMFYISPQTIPTEQTPVTLMPTTKITPTVESATEEMAPTLPKTQRANLTSLFNKNGQSVTAAQTTLLVLLQKLLPLALRSNLTNLLSQRNEIIELSRRIDFKHLLQNSTIRREPKVPQRSPGETPGYLNTVHVTPTTKTSSIEPFTLKSVTPAPQHVSTNVHAMHPTATHARSNIQVQKTWRPWYFAVASSERDR